MLAPSPHVVKSPVGELISLDSQGEGIDGEGFYRGPSTASGLIHVRQVESFVDDVVSLQHEPGVCVSHFSLANSHTGELNAWDRANSQGESLPSFNETLESSVQDTVSHANMYSEGYLVKDCSLLTGTNDLQEEPTERDIKYDNSGVDDVLLGSYCSPMGSVVNVYDSCVYGKCKCKYLIGGIPCQLRPCRFAAVMFTNPSWGNSYQELLWSIVDGFPIVEADVPSYRCSNYSSILEAKSKTKMDGIVKAELAEGIISEVDYVPACIHALGAVSKPSGGIRPITDCSRPEGKSVNNYCTELFKEFSYKSVDDVVEILKWGMYMSVVDIKAAYRAVPIRESHRKFMGFEWELDGIKKVFVENRLCFGLRLGPQYFQLISNFIHDTLLYVHGVETINYLDDFITLGRSYSSCLQAQRKILKVLRDLGFYVAYDKVSPPSTCTTFLGVEIDSIAMELRLPESKIEKLNCYLDKYVAADRISKKELESLGGLLSHCASLVRGGKTFCRRLYNLYKEVCGKGYKSIKIPEIVKSDLNWWKVFCRTFNGVSQINNVDYHHAMISDASRKGFGVYMGSDWAAGSWDQQESLTVQSTCKHIVEPPIQDRDIVDFDNINVLELWPILVGLKRWSSVLQNKTLTLFTDNTQVMHMLIKGSSTNTTCMAWIKEVYWLCVFNNIELKPKYVNTNNNLVADTLSRLNYFKVITDPMEALNGTDLCCIQSLLDNYREKR